MIRPYRPEDLPRLREITIESFPEVSIDRNIEQQFGLFGAHDWRDRKAKSIDRDCETNPAGVFVWEEDADILGYVTTRLDRYSGIGSIPNLAVEAESRSRGIGTALIRFAMDYLADQGMVMCRIETLEQNQRGQELYPKFGFREVARQIHYAGPLPRRDREETPAESEVKA
jgi:ribosomal protein S18 acetylase RimI-like enzyme